MAGPQSDVPVAPHVELGTVALFWVPVLLLKPIAVVELEVL